MLLKLIFCGILILFLLMAVAMYTCAVAGKISDEEMSAMFADKEDENDTL